MIDIMRYISNLSIRSKLLVGYVTAFVLFLAVGGLIIYPIMQKTIEANIESELNNTTKTILSMVKTAADASIKNYLRAVAETNKNIVEQSYKLYTQGMLSEQDAKKRAVSILLSQRIGKTGYIYCLDSKGIIRVHPVVALLGADLTRYGFIQEQLKNREGYIEYDWKNPGELKTRPKALYMTYFKPWDWIISASSYREEFIQLINIDNFRESILSIRFGKTGYSYIMDSRGNLIAHPALTGNTYDVKDSKGREFVKEMSEKKNGKIIYTWRNPDEKEYREKLVIFNYIPEFDWIVASSSYVEEFYEPLNHIRLIIIALFITALILLLLLTYLYSAYIVKGLNKLIQSFQTGSTGDLSVRMSKTSGDEFGRIADYFNAFIEKLDAYNRSFQQEIAERRRIEEALRESEKRLSQIIDFLPDATFAIDLDGKVIVWNRAAEEYTGVKAEDMLGKADHEHSIPFYGARRPILIDLVLNPSEKIEKLYPYIIRESGMVIGEGYTRNVKRGEAYMFGIAAPLYDFEGNVIGAIESIRDVTERKKLEEQLRHVQKMDAVGTFAGGVAHDFNNILTVIIGYGSLLRPRLDDGNPLKNYVDDILAAAERAANLTRRLLAFSRKQIMSPDQVNLNEIVKRFEKFLMRVIGEDIEFKIHLSDKDLIVMADRGQIEQVLMNLATNARDSMPAGGILTIKTERVDIVGLNGYIKPGSYAVITVSDTGRGMDEATRLRIFEPFYTTKETGKGTGLGLSIVYGIIKQHNGEVNVYSEPGKGTTFKIYLKLIDTRIEGTKVSAPAIPVGGTETILIAEDDAVVRKLVKGILEEHGYTVIEATDGEDAVARFTENKDSVQLLLLDVVMPRKNGKEAYEEIHRIKENVPVLFTSGYTADIINKNGSLEEGMNFITKPVTPQLLLSKVREILDK